MRSLIHCLKALGARVWEGEKAAKEMREEEREGEEGGRGDGGRESDKGMGARVLFSAADAYLHVLLALGSSLRVAVSSVSCASFIRASHSSCSSVDTWIVPCMRI